MPPRVCGVVLGASSSRRPDRPKQTLPLGDTTLLGWVVRDVEVSSLEGDRRGRRSEGEADLHGDKAVWKILDAQPERVRRVPVDRPLPADVDTWEDYLEVCRTFGFTPAPPAGP